jgi:hypothetical protein
MNEVTRMLSAIEQRQPHDAQQVHQELQLRPEDRRPHLRRKTYSGALKDKSISPAPC